MLSDQDRHYHMQRARQELELAYDAERQTVIEAHMKLSALHMARLRQADEGCNGDIMRTGAVRG
jgi:hypothetical protein